MNGLSLRDLQYNSSSDEQSLEAPPFSHISESDHSKLSSPSSTPALSSPPDSPNASVLSLSLPGTEDPSVISLDHWKGFKLVGDNIDKNVRASYQRIGRTTRSLHYFHTYAVLDRVDFSGLSDEPLPPSIVDPLSFLPSDRDKNVVERDMIVLMSR